MGNLTKSSVQKNQNALRSFITAVFLTAVLALSVIMLCGGIFGFKHFDNANNFAHAAETESQDVFIYTAADFDKLVDDENDGKRFLLKNDIDLSTHGEWTPLDTYGRKGNFDGGGFSINGLKITGVRDYSGLFSKNSLNIKNLFIKTVDISNAQSAGVIAVENYGTIENVHVSCTTLAADLVAGGLIAENYGSIDNCSFEGTVTARTAAGLVADHNESYIKNSYSKGSVNGQKIGGVISLTSGLETSQVVIENVFSTAVMTQETYDETLKWAGAVIGNREGSVTVSGAYCNSGGSPCIARGDRDGGIELSATDRINKASYVGFDFDNYWNWDEINNVLSQRTVAVSSNTVEIDGVSAVVCGDKLYYNKGEMAVLSISVDTDTNLGIKSAFINGTAVTISGGKCTFAVDGQMNVNFNTRYLLSVLLNDEIEFGSISQEKSYYAPDEDIIIKVSTVNKSKFKSLSPKYNNEVISYKKVSADTYKIILPDGITEYSSDSMLYVDALFEAHNPNILLIILGVTIPVVLLVVVIGLYFILTKKYNKKSVAEIESGANEKVIQKRKGLFNLCYFLGVGTIAVLGFWVLLIADVFTLGVAQLALIIALPLLICVGVGVAWLKTKKYQDMKEKVESSDEGKGSDKDSDGTEKVEEEVL